MYEIKTFLCCPEMTTLCCWGQRTSAKSKQPKKYLKKRALKRFPVNNQVPCSGTTGWPPISDFHQLTSRKLSPLEWMSSRLHQNCHPLQILMYTDMFPLSLLLSHSHFYTFTFPFSLPLFHFYISISLSYFHTFPLLLSLSYFHFHTFTPNCSPVQMVILTMPGSRTFWARGDTRRSSSTSWGTSDVAEKIRSTFGFALKL